MVVVYGYNPDASCGGRSSPQLGAAAAARWAVQEPAGVAPAPHAPTKITRYSFVICLIFVCFVVSHPTPDTHSLTVATDHYYAIATAQNTTTATLP